MPLRVTFEISDRDLRHFRREMRKAREAVKIAEDEEIIRAARESLRDIRQGPAPDFVRDRLVKLESIIDMVEDPTWQLPAAETSQALAALVYFSDPEDLIPDHVPGVGLLDDAIMIELAYRQVRHAVDAYREYCRYCTRLLGTVPSQQVGAPVRTRLEGRRKALHDRMRRRAAKERARP